MDLSGDNVEAGYLSLLAISQSSLGQALLPTIVRMKLRRFPVAQKLRIMERALYATTHAKVREKLGPNPALALARLLG